MDPVETMKNSLIIPSVKYVMAVSRRGHGVVVYGSMICRSVVLDVARSSSIVFFFALFPFPGSGECNGT